MTPATLFNIILKVFGMFLIVKFVEMIPQILSILVFSTQTDSLAIGLIGVISTLLMMLPFGLFVYLLIFRSTYLVKKFKLVEGMGTEKLEINIHRSTVLGISIVVMGGLIIVNEAPNFCKILFSYFHQRRASYGDVYPDHSLIVWSIVKILIGVLLMSSSRTIVNFIERQRKA